jgi:hypothetical protein
MRFDKSYLSKCFAGNQVVLNRINSIKGDYAEIDIMSPEAYKTYKQNRLFHSLLNVFWDSGCSSYLNYDDLRRSYKRLCGLVKVQDGWLIERSWSEATKEQAQRGIDNLLREMDEAGVIASSQGKKYEAILKQLGCGYDS